MRVSISLTEYSWPEPLPAALDRVLDAADAAGLHTVWLPDHLIQAAPGTADDDPMLEAYTTLGYLAARTERVRLGTMVSAVTYRPPALLVKAVTTLDVLSGGRAWLGVGAGYHEEEAHRMGLPLPPVAERFERLEEALEVAREQWSGAASPAPASRPRPPVLIGGMGERKTLRLVARHADACNLFDIPDGGKTVRHKLDVLARHCQEAGRPYEEIDKTLSTRWVPGEPAPDFAERCAGLAGFGIEHVVVITDGAWSEDGVRTVAAALAV